MNGVEEKATVNAILFFLILGVSLLAQAKEPIVIPSCPLKAQGSLNPVRQCFAILSALSDSNIENIPWVVQEHGQKTLPAKYLYIQAEQKLAETGARVWPHYEGPLEENSPNVQSAMEKIFQSEINQIWAEKVKDQSARLAKAWNLHSAVARCMFPLCVI